MKTILKSIIYLIIIYFIWTLFSYMKGTSSVEEKKNVEYHSKYDRIEQTRKNFEKNENQILKEIEELIKNKNYDEALKKLKKYKNVDIPNSKIEKLFIIAKVSKIKIELKKLPVSKYRENLKLYRELLALEPNNKIYIEKIKFYNNKLIAQNKIVLAQNKKNREIALSHLDKKYDDIKNITWYKDKTSTKYRNENAFYLYFSPNNLRLVIQYYADNWLFIDNYIIKADDKIYTINGRVERDNGNGGKIWEWIDINVNNKIEILTNIANSSNAKIRFNGKQYYEERIITEREKEAMKNILISYKYLSK